VRKSQLVNDDHLLLLRLVGTGTLASKIGEKELAAYMHGAAAVAVLDIARRQTDKRLPPSLIHALRKLVLPEHVLHLAGETV
jgi:hypothetical protein